MISLFTGPVGSGKSYHAVELGVINLRVKYVIANFPIKSPKYSKLIPKAIRKRLDQQYARWIYMEEITVAKLIALSIEKGFMSKESSAIIIIDEAGVIFNSRDWAVQGQHRMRWIKFMAQSRKLGYDIVMVAQFDRMIDRQMRSMVEYEVKHLKANNSFFLRWLSMFKVTLFLYVYRWYQTRLKANLRFSIYKPYIANRYDTMRTFDLDDLVAEVRKIYEGVVIPAAVAAQLVIWEDEIKERIRLRNAVGEHGGPVASAPNCEKESETDGNGSEDWSDQLAEHWEKNIAPTIDADRLSGVDHIPTKSS